MRIHHLDLTVSNFDRSYAFYNLVLPQLGLTAMRHNPPDEANWRGVSLDFAIHEGESNAPPHNRYGPGLHHFAFDASSREVVDAFFEFLLANQLQVLDAPAQYNHYEQGYYAVFFADPDGIKLELVHTPLWRPA